jgi:hypothetical protein
MLSKLQVERSGRMRKMSENNTVIRLE